MITVPDLTIIANWLKKLNVTYYQCENCTALHLAHLQKFGGIADAKVDLLDDIITISIVSEIKQSAIPALLSELSQINSSTFLAKVYLDVNDSDLPKIIFSYSMHAAEGITFNQFSLSLSSLEEEVLQIVSELESCDLLLNSDSVVSRAMQYSPQTYH